MLLALQLLLDCDRIAVFTAKRCLGPRGQSRLCKPYTSTYYLVMCHLSNNIMVQCASTHKRLSSSATLGYTYNIYVYSAKLSYGGVTPLVYSLRYYQKIVVSWYSCRHYRHKAQVTLDSQCFLPLLSSFFSIIFSRVASMEYNEALMPATSQITVIMLSSRFPLGQTRIRFDRA